MSSSPGFKSKFCHYEIGCKVYNFIELLWEFIQSACGLLMMNDSLYAGWSSGCRGWIDNKTDRVCGSHSQPDSVKDS